MVIERQSFEKLLERNRSLPIHIRNLQIFATEISKVSKDLAPIIFSEIFLKRSIQYNLRHVSEFYFPTWKALFGTKSLSYLGPNIRGLVANELKEFKRARELSSLSAFKKAIKKWKLQNCPYRLCKKYIQSLGFIWYFIWHS